MGGRHLVGDPEPVASRAILCADGELERDLRANASGVCREGKPLHTFPDHALSGAALHASNIIPRQRDC